MENYLLPQPGTVRDETKMKVITKQSSRVTERTESARGSTRRLPHSTPTRVAANTQNVFLGFKDYTYYKISGSVIDGAKYYFDYGE
jgi:hypothetical protein